LNVARHPKATTVATATRQDEFLNDESPAVPGGKRLAVNMSDQS
jgi:hypothetical protein